MTKPIQLALLIDDNEIDQRQYTRIIKRSGLVEELMTFTYADEALQFLESNPQLEVDLILLDVLMPRMNGFEFLEAASAALGREFAKIVVVMLTTSLDPSDKERASRYEMVDNFINKPLSAQHIEEAASRLASQ